MGVNPRPQAYFYNTTDTGGGYFLPPPPLSELMNYWTDLQNSNSVPQIWRICRWKPNIVDLGVSDDVTGQAKVKMFDDLEYLVLWRTRAV